MSWPFTEASAASGPADETSSSLLQEAKASERRLSARTRSARWVAPLLAALALIAGPRLDDDSYQHFAHSVQQVSTLNWSEWLKDLWNKPLPGLLFGLPGLSGLEAARLLSVALSLATIYLTVRLCEALIPSRVRGESWTAVALCLGQLAFLRDAFVTMTEIPAAFCLALALWMHLVAGRTRAAALVAGFMPLCRAETLPIAGFIGVWLASQPSLSSRARPSAWRMLMTVSSALLPFAAWYAAGALVSQDWSWFARDSYAQLRAWDLAGCLRFNVLSGLASVVPPPLAILLFAGMIASPRLLSARVAWLCAGCCAIHYTLLNVLDVFPRGVEGVPYGHAVAAINARNYTSTAPITALYCALGVVAWIEGRRERDARYLRTLACAAALSLLAIVSARASDRAALLRDLCLWLASLALLWPPSAAGAPLPARKAWQRVALASLGAALLVRPGFFYPTRWNDQRAAGISSMARLVHERAPKRVVQDMAASLDFYGHLHNVDADWTWPRQFPARLLEEPAATVLVLEVDAAGHPLTRYPDSLGACATPDALVATYDSPRQPRWLTLVDRVAARNAPVHWRAYRVSPACAAAQH